MAPRGKKSDFEMGEGARFSYQHDARRQKDGTITIFDNGTTVFHSNTPEAVEGSRGIVLELDEEQMSASLVREYTHPDKQYAHAAGNVQVLPNSNVFIGWGRAGKSTRNSARMASYSSTPHYRPPTDPTGISASRGAGTLTDRPAAVAERHLRRGGEGLRKLERSHRGFHLGGARRPAPGPNKAPRLGSQKRLRDGHGGCRPPTPTSPCRPKTIQGGYLVLLSLSRCEPERRRLQLAWTTRLQREEGKKGSSEVRAGLSTS